MKAVALVFAVVVPAVAAQVVVEPRDLGFRIVRRDNVSGHHEAVEIIMSSIMEMVRVKIASRHRVWVCRIASRSLAVAAGGCHFMRSVLVLLGITH